MNLNQVTIYTEKTVETVEFFEKLGLRRIVDSLPRYARLECPDGESSLSVNVADSNSPNESITLYFECSSLDEKVTDLKACGLEFEKDPSDRPWLWREAYLRDPNNNRVCLFYAGENRLNPPWRLNREACK